MILKTMYPPQKDSPSTFLTGSITSSSTLVTVGNASVLPQTVPFPLTIGIDKPVTETVMVTAIGSGNNQLTITRSAGSLAWEAGALCARVFNAADLKTVQDNLTDVVAQTNTQQTDIDDLKTKTTANTTGITNLGNSINNVASDLANEVTRATNAESGLNANKINRTELPQVITDWSYKPTSTSMGVEVNRYNANTQTGSVINKNIPMVNYETAGIMTPEAYNEISTLRGEVASLMNQGGKYIGMSFDTKAELDAFVIPAGYVKPNDYTYVLDDEEHDGATTKYVYMGDPVWGNLIANPFGSSLIYNIETIGDVVFAVGDTGKMARSTDGGITWSSLITNPFGTAALRSIGVIDNTILVGAQDGKMARSTDGGITWSSLITNPFGTATIYAFAAVDNILVAAGGNKIARSTDNGLTWDSSIATPFSGSVNIYEIINTNGVLIAVASFGGLARSTDKGLTWTIITTPLSVSTAIRSITESNGIVIAVNQQGQIARSTDKGLTWTLVDNPFQSTPIYIIQNINGMVVAGGENGKISHSYDQGLHWSDLMINYFGNIAIYGLTDFKGVGIATTSNGRIARYTSQFVFTMVVEHDPVEIATATVPGIVKSDSGTTEGKVFVEMDGTMSVVGWNDFDARFDNIEVKMEEIIETGTIEIPNTGWSAYNGMDIYKFKKDIPIPGVTSASWVDISIAAARQHTAQTAEICPTIDEYDGGVTMYAKTQPAITIPAKWKSSRLVSPVGKNWGSLIANSFGGSIITKITSVNGVAVAVGASGKIARSLDNGLTWGSLITNPFGTTNILALANVNGVVIAGGQAGKIARSTDNGLTWGSLIANSFGTYAIYSITDINGVAIAVGDSGTIARSTDNGLTWGSLIASPFGTSTINAIANINGVAIIATGGKIARSTDGGLTWGSPVDTPFEYSSINAIANINGAAIAVGQGGKIARSTDNGLTWGNLITNPFDTTAIYSIANVNGVAIAAGSGGKIARSTDNGLTWSPLINNSFDTTAVRAIDNVNGVAIAGGDSGKTARSYN